MWARPAAAPSSAELVVVALAVRWQDKRVGELIVELVALEVEVELSAVVADEGDARHAVPRRVERGPGRVPGRPLSSRLQAREGARGRRQLGGTQAPLCETLRFRGGNRHVSIAYKV